MKSLPPEWLIITGAMLWGTTGTAQALAPPESTPLAVGALRLGIGGLALLAIALGRGLLPSQGRWPWGATLLAALCIAGYQVSFFAAVAATGVAVGTIVGIGSAPVLAGALDWLVERRDPGRRWAIATALAICGCALLAFSGGGTTFQLGGILLALTAGASYALYTLASKRLLTGRAPEAVMAVIFCLGALLLAPLLWWVDVSWLAQPRGLFVALHLGLATTALAYILFGHGLQRLSASAVVTLSLAEPLTAGLLGVVVLREPLLPSAWVGILLLIVGLWYLARG